ncbi:hypothetical protein [Stutzerimonas stutzeri]|uniref:hypothetical protein n=1 Tax=Stutzerimonas stutzeri TaxID=316 RepID=UPI00210A1ABE|nr:hypothetical protein [Stutzerimonas stutzeri]MCQ4319276.1 hypothetical protein [Stutzerimonas stutzeri]
MKRRTLLISSAAALGLVAVGSGAWVFEDRQVFVPQLLQRLVGNFQMDPDDQRKFVDAMADHYGSEKLTALMGLYKIRQQTGVGTAYTELRLDNFERRLLTDFMVSTDFLRQQNKTNPKVSFLGYRLPCSNPYARFDGLA